MKRTARAIPAGGPVLRLVPLLLSLALAGCRASDPASVVLESPEKFDSPRAVAAAGDRVYVLDETGHFYGLDHRGRLLAKTRLIKTMRGFPVGLTPE